MKTKQLLIAATLGTGALMAHQVVAPTLAQAQSTTAGAIQGVVTDGKDKLAGVTITVSSPALQGTQTAITDENGFYKIDPLPPGEYIVTFFYLDAQVDRSGVSVGINKVTPVYQKLSSDPTAGEVVQVHDSAPTIDPTSTTQGVTIDKNYLKNIPIPGRTFEAALGAAAGSQNDGAGVSFSGSSSLENQYYVDGVNTTGLTFGTVGSPVINDFVEEIEVITGGYNAEFGRATGGVVNVVTKSGSNELKGSIFGTYRPGQLTYSSERTPSNAASIDATADNGYIVDFDFEVGGPIIKDKLWFFVGFVPSFSGVNVTRTIKRRTDCRTVMPDGSLSDCDSTMGGPRNGIPDIDPEAGFFITEDIDSSIRTGVTKTYNAIGKINYALNPENQGQISLQALPATVESPAIYGPTSSGTKGKQLTTDLSAKWTSKFNDNKTEIEAIAGWHRDYVKTDPFDSSFADSPLQVLTGSSLGVLGPNFGESMATNRLCHDVENPTTTEDKYPLIVNCPMTSVPYVIGGPGTITDDTEQRFAGKINVTERLKAAGNHEIKAGVDLENNLRDKVRAFSGGGFIQNDLRSDTVRVTRYVQLLGLRGTPQTDNPDPRFDSSCNTPDPNGGIGLGGGTLNYVCDYLEPGGDGTRVKGDTFNWAAYLRDSWQIRPNVTLNAGLRYEEQRLRYADTLANQRDPLTQEPLGKNAMVLKGMFAPRVGILYDWTKEGRSKLYANYGRYYESIPMDINDRSFGGETTYQQDFSSAGATCAMGMDDPKIGGTNGETCLTTTSAAAQEQLIGASGTLVAPGIKAQYLDEIIGGFEYEIIDDLKIGVSYQNRRLGRVIEDVSTDGASTYLIANPGEFSDKEVTKLMDRITATDDPTEKARLQNQLTLFNGIKLFDKPSRTYNALQFTATRRFSKKLYVQGSYTYSRTQGNYPGLISYDNGQIDPNISSQYDLIELLANRVGPLPQDRPHYIKLDGYYTFDLKKAGSLTLGTRVRALSGIPENALAGHYLYGPNESFLLPRGQIGRTDFEHGLDLHIGYGKDLTKGTKIEVYADLYNVYNRQGSAGVDDNYAPQFDLGGTEQNANPISGGTYEDLIWVKAINNAGGERQDPIGRNPNFRNTNSRYSPGYVQLGMRLTF